MLTPEDDQAYFDLQNANHDYWQEFGNTIDESVEAVTARRLAKGGARFGIYKDGVLIGIEGCVTDEAGRGAEVGILLSKDHSGHGYATSAARTLSGFIAPQFERVFAEVAPDNDRSIQLMERSGYHRVGGKAMRDWGPAAVFEYRK